MNGFSLVKHEEVSLVKFVELGHSTLDYFTFLDTKRLFPLLWVLFFGKQLFVKKIKFQVIREYLQIWTLISNGNREDRQSSSIQYLQHLFRRWEICVYFLLLYGISTNFFQFPTMKTYPYARKIYRSTEWSQVFSTVTSHNTKTNVFFGAKSGNPDVSSGYKKMLVILLPPYLRSL